MEQISFDADLEASRLSQKLNNLYEKFGFGDGSGEELALLADTDPAAFNILTTRVNTKAWIYKNLTAIYGLIEFHVRAGSDEARDIADDLLNQIAAYEISRN